METLNLGDGLVEQVRVDDRLARGDVSFVARLFGHSAPCAAERNVSPIMTITCALLEMVETMPFGSQTCSNVGNASFTSCSMRCLTTCQANSFTSEGGS